jgi:hypothetical protein
MGAPNVSSAILTISTARTTPAQKPRGFKSMTRFWEFDLADSAAVAGDSMG